MPWQEDLVDFLIDSGTTGRDTSEILRKFQGRASAAMIENELRAYQAENKAQRFSIPPVTKGRPKSVWRATTEMLGTPDKKVVKPKPKRV